MRRCLYIYCFVQVIERTAMVLHTLGLRAPHKVEGLTRRLAACEYLRIVSISLQKRAQVSTYLRWKS